VSPASRFAARRPLVALYALFALAAGARSAVQLTTRADQAPLPYALSALAAAVYLIAAVALTRPGKTARRVALGACTLELAGVVAVGTVSVAAPDTFPDATVWSHFGRGYGHLPLVLPLLGLAVLVRHHAAPNTAR